MNEGYKKAFASLNTHQRQAVETIDGPIMVIAGPGTGKTQLISTRAGYILSKTDTPADAILLLTFTEAGVEAMRERLARLIGRPAYDIQLNTYHAFGGEIFRRYPDYFEDAQLTLLEELGADNLLRGIIAKLPYSDPLKFADSYISDIKTFISEAKRALLSPDDVDEIAADNLKFIAKTNQGCSSILNKLTTVSKSTVPIFEELLDSLSSDVKEEDLPDAILPLVRYAQGELEAALEFFNDNRKTTLLTEWKRRWLARDADGNYILDGRRLNERLRSAGRIYKKYQQTLRKERLYDYDDMIIRAIEALETNSELRYSIAERYSYIMLDEFQDTNPAQFKLVQLLTDHPVHEGRPNILAVGDDDQAIYAFQGADHANMTSFINHYRDVKIINLTENYRAWSELIQLAKNVSSQIQSSLINQLGNVKKELTAAAKELSEPPKIVAREFKSDAAQYDWVAAEIKKLINKGMPAEQIAVLAPKHRFLTPLLPYLSHYHIPTHYERRENILDETIVHQLEQMSRLVLALAEGDERLSNYLWAEVLSYDFWNVRTEKIWQLSWSSRQSHEPWTALLLNDDQLKPIASFFIKLATLIETASLEQQIDALIGVGNISEELKLPLLSPMYDFYFSKQAAQTNAIEFSRLISNLNVLRSKLLDWRHNIEQPIGLRAFVEFIAGHRAAGLSILNTSPYQATTSAVNLMTAYGAKGREFRTVFIVSAVDEVWGSASRNQGYRLSLPSNLTYIRYQGASEDERLRLLYVALTRARTQLYITSYAQDLSGKNLTRLKYMDIEETQNGLIAGILPDKFAQIQEDTSESISLQASISYWTQKHLPPFKSELRQVLEQRLKNYQMSATDLNHFINLIDYGPDNFFMKCLLLFPSAPTITDSFGTAIHNTLRFCGNILINEGQLPNVERLVEIFEAQLARIDLPPDQFENLLLRGSDSLRAWLTQRAGDLSRTDRFEYDFQKEGARLGEVRLNGKVDRMIIDERRKTITVVDYKTGRAYNRWQAGVIKLHLFQHQLQFYKLLIENSARFRKYRVEKGIIEFVEPDEQGQIRQLELSFDKEAEKDKVQLINTVWACIQSLKFPDVSGYPPTLAGIRQFEKDLIAANQSKNAG